MRNSYAWWLGWLWTVGLAGGFCLAPLTGHADAQFTLAESKIHKLRVLASGGDAWCQSHLSLQMVLDAGSPDAKDPQSLVGLMNRLKAPITAECKSAQTAELALMNDGKTVGSYSASAAGGWVFSPVQPQPAAKASPAEQANVAAKPATSASPAPSGSQPPTAASATSAAAGTLATAAPPAKPAPVVGVDYPGLLLLYLRQNPKLAQDDKMVHWWASYLYPKEYWINHNEEFKLQPILAKARIDLAEALVQSDPVSVILNINTHFGSYNFSSKQFPMSITGPLDETAPNYSFSNSYSISAPFPNTIIPRTFRLKVSGLDFITGLPMDEGDAQNFVQQRTANGMVRRSIEVAATVKLGTAWGGGKIGWNGIYVVNATLESAAILDGKSKKVLYRVTEAQIAQMRAKKEAVQAAAAQAAKEKQEAAQEKQAAAARAEQAQEAAAQAQLAALAQAKQARQAAAARLAQAQQAAAARAEQARRAAAVHAEEEQQAAAIRAEQARQIAAASAAQARWEALQRQQRLAQRQQTIRTLASLPIDVRLWNFMTRGSLNSDGHLDDLRAARADALIRGQPVSVVMLVQMDSSGRDKVATKWPGHLDVSVPAAEPELKGAGWYLVRGMLTVPDGDGLPSAQLAGTDVYACSKAQCADAADATAIIDRKQAELSATKH